MTTSAAKNQLPTSPANHPPAIPLKAILKTIKLNPSATSSTAAAAICHNTCTTIEQCAFYAHPGFRPKVTPRGTSIERCQTLIQWQIARHTANLQALADIPERFRHLSFSDYQCSSADRQAFKNIINATYDKLPALITGQGKTLLLCLIGNEFCSQDVAVQYTTASELTLHLRYTLEDCEANLHHLQQVPALLIDDLGAERPSEFNEEQLYMVLEGRQRKGNPTYITSRLSFKFLLQNYGKHLQTKLKRIFKREEHFQGRQPR